MNNQEVNIRSYSQMLQDGLEEVFGSSEYQRFLSFIANNPTYSYRNVILILQQLPTATKVMGFQAWKKSGRVPNQRGLRINARFARNEEEQSLIEKNPRKNQGKGKGKDKNFRRISVFDISQTIVIDEDLAYMQVSGEREEPEFIANDAVIPFRTDMLEGEVDGYDEIMQSIGAFTPLPIRFRSSQRADGSLNDSEITIRGDMSQLHTIRTVINQVVRCWRKPFCDDREQLEIEAESVAFIVCQYLGLDTSEFSFNYIAQYSHGKERKHLEDFLDKIQKSALYFIDSIDGVREAARLAYDISEYFLLVRRKTAQYLFQGSCPVYLVYPGEGELLATKTKELESHEGPYATDRYVWFNTRRMAA